jgi:hypothetical protein
MRPRKTDKAHHALRDRPADVNAFERRVLILSDGKRDVDEVAELLGAQAREAMKRLLRDGYLVDLEGAAAGTAVDRDQAPPEPSTAPAPPARRSIVAAKMYALDMLRLQRGSDAAAIAAAIHACRNQDELAAHVLQALRHFHAVTSLSYSRRVADQLAEVMPEQYLAELDVFRDALFANDLARA